VNPDVTARLAVAGAVYAVLVGAHTVGDHWVQTGAQACRKGAPGLVGWVACVGHVATLTACKVLGLVGLAVVTGWRPHLVLVAGALTADAVSHGWADRRHTLAALADRVGKGEFYRLGQPSRAGDAPHLGTGAYALDQAWHVGWLVLTALVVAGGTP
jgi:hypothetical protein